MRYTNRKGQVYYLHQGTTKSGTPKYFFSQKSDGRPIPDIPDGYEVYENPNGRVSLRRIRPRIITDAEVAVVEKAMKQHSDVRDYRIDLRDAFLLVWLPDQDVKALTELFSEVAVARPGGVRAALDSILTYSPRLRFTLADVEARRFVAERYCFLAGIDDWIRLSGPDRLENLANKYVKHLGKDSFSKRY